MITIRNSRPDQIKETRLREQLTVSGAMEPLTQPNHHGHSKRGRAESGSTSMKCRLTAAATSSKNVASGNCVDTSRHILKYICVWEHNAYAYVRRCFH